jgi:ribonucleoside-diphosphate reductase alpha chain
LKERYLQKDETPEGMCWRVARAIAEAERGYGKTDEEISAVSAQFAEAMINRDFMPNSPALMNAGTGNGLTTLACLVLPIEDSMDGIFQTLKDTAMVHKAGAGTGYSFNRLRPSGATVKTTNGVSSGPVSFMQVFNAATNAVKQGSLRRGAALGLLEVNHPDIFEFIQSKVDGSLTNFNISVGITDDFIRAVDEDADFALVHGGKEYKRVKAREIWDAIVDCAWRTGDPGLVFMDVVNNTASNPTPKLARIEGVNSCAELALFPYEPCCLSSINLGNFVKEVVDFTEGTYYVVDWERLAKTVHLVVRFLDDVIDVGPYPLPQIAETAKNYRRIGLGVMGWADMLIKLGIPYDSNEALDLAEELMVFINDAGHRESMDLVKDRGAFPLFKDSIYADGAPMRNAGITTIPPTGTTSIIANASSGIEPLFALAFVHDNQLGRRLEYVNPLFVEKAKEAGVYSEQLMEHVKTHGTLHGYPLPASFVRIFPTAHEIAPEWHVKMQASFQKGVDASISKSVNLLNSATREDISKIYRMAYDLGCKGITVYRDGCKGAQVLNVGITPKVEPVLNQQKKSRVEVLDGKTYRTETPLGTAYVTVNADQDGPFEVFVNVGRAGSDVAADSEALSRLISLTLRLPSPIPQQDRLGEIANQLEGIGGAQSLGFGPNRVKSLPDAISKVLNKCKPETKSSETQSGETQRNEAQRADYCPECGNASLVYEEGCGKCYSCGHSKC